jgi:hypothetical protein
MRLEMTPEDELCLLLARGQLSSGVQARAVELLAASLNWDQILARAEEHGVFPLVYRSLRTLDFHGVPDEVQSKLRAAFRHNVARNMLFAAELSRLLAFLGVVGVRVIPLKGVALAELLYGDPAYRFCSDIDILVPPSDAPRARRLLIEQGYSSPFTEEFFLNHQLRTSADSPLQARRGGLDYFLELHWTLLQHAAKDAEAIEDLWSQARPREFFGAPAYGLTPEWELLYLSTHAAYHRWQTLKWIADVHDLCASVSIDWQLVREKAERFELDRALGSTLAVCSRLYGITTPADFPTFPIPAGVPLFPHSLDPSEAWDAPLFHFKLLKHPGEKLRWLAEMFFVARQADVACFHLPASLEFLYFVLRPLRLACKWSRRLLSAGYTRLR